MNQLKHWLTLVKFSTAAFVWLQQKFTKVYICLSKNKLLTQNRIQVSQILDYLSRQIIMTKGADVIYWRSEHHCSSTFF